MKQTRLTRIYARNALSCKKVDLRLDNQGLVLVRGLNGAGKSAVFEALRHMLLGSTARGIKGKEFVRAGSKGGYLGLLEIERDGQPYTVQQAIGHKKHGTSTVIYRGEELISHQRAKVRTQKQVSEELLGMTAQQFDSWVFISQEAAHPLVNGSGSECASYLSESFGLDVYDEIIQKMKEAVKQAESKVSETKAHEQRLATIEQRLSVFRQTKSTTDAETVERLLHEANEHISSSQEKLLRAKKLGQDFEERDRLRAKQGDYLDPDVTELRETAQTLERRIQVIDEKLATHRAATNQRAQRKAQEAKLDALETAIEQLNKVVVKDLLGVQIEALIADGKTEIERLIGEAAPLHKLERVDGLKECPTCGGELDAAHHAKELSKARAAAKDLADVRRKVSALETEYREGQNRIEDLDRKTKQRDELAASLKEQSNREEPDVDPEKLSQRRQQTQQTLRDIERAIDATEQLNKRPDLLRLTGSPDEIPARIKAAEAELATSMQQATLLNRQYGELKATQREIELLTAQAEEVRQEIERTQQFKHENELRKKLIKALARLKVRRIHGIVEAIQQTLPTYVDAMFDGEDVIVEVDDQDPDSIERWCSRPHPTEEGERIRIPLRAMSKGERARLRVAFIWAVRRLMRPERTINILVLDEADGGLDQKGLEAYGSLLEQLRTEYESVFVISHRKELNTVRFDRKWTVTKSKAGSSQLVEES